VDTQFDGFLEKKADEYVARLGEEKAILKLSRLAGRSEQARKILEIVTRGAGWRQPQPSVCGSAHRDHVTKWVLDPKEVFLNRLGLLGLPMDTVADKNWNPVVPVEWVDGRAMINGYHVRVCRKHLGFMERNVFGRRRFVFNMRVVDVKNGKDKCVFVEPDVQDFYRRLRQRRRRREVFFEGEVSLGYRGLRIQSSSINKRVRVPRRFLSMLLLDPGCWRFKVLGENGDGVVAEPVEKLEQSESISNMPGKKPSETKSSTQIFPYTKPMAGVAAARLDTLLREGRVCL